MILYLSPSENLVIERVGHIVECRHGRSIMDTYPATMGDRLDTYRARRWVIENIWSRR